MYSNIHIWYNHIMHNPCYLGKFSKTKTIMFYFLLNTCFVDKAIFVAILCFCWVKDKFLTEHLWFLSACFVECYHIIYTCRYALKSLLLQIFSHNMGTCLLCTMYVCNFMYIGERIRSQLNACKNELVVKLRKEANFKISIQDINVLEKVL